MSSLDKWTLYCRKLTNYTKTPKKEIIMDDRELQLWLSCCQSLSEDSRSELKQLLSEIRDIESNIHITEELPDICGDIKLHYNVSDSNHIKAIVPNEFWDMIFEDSKLEESS